MFHFIFSYKKGLYALKTRKRENDVFVGFFLRACELCKVNVNIHIALTLLVNQETKNVGQLIFALRRNSLD